MVGGQQLSITIDGEERIFWSNGKRNTEENSEYGDLPFNAVLELSEEEFISRGYGFLVAAVCELEE